MRKWSWVMAAVLLAAAALIGAQHATRLLYAAPPPPAGSRGSPEPPAAQTPGQPATGDKATREIVLEHADRALYDNKAKQWQLTGTVVVRHEDGVLRAQNIRLNTETKKGSASGDLSFTDRQTVITATRLEIDFDAREVAFKGDVRLVTEKKAENEKAAAKQPTPEVKASQNKKSEEEKPFRERSYERTEMQCPELAYNYHDHLATARNGVTARQKDRSGRADAATYNDKDELLVLTGNVQMKDEKGQTFRANKITISIAQDWLEAEGVGPSRFLVEEEKQAEAEKPQATAPPAGGGEKPTPETQAPPK